MSADQILKVVKKNKKKPWAWARLRWTNQDLVRLGPSMLSGHFIELADQQRAIATWLQFIRRFSETEGPRPVTREKLDQLMSFLKSISSADDIFGLLREIRKEFRLLKILGEPILLLSRPDGFTELFYYRGGDPIRRKINNGPPPSQRVRIHDPKDRQFLADHLGRPFGKVIAFPLAQERSSGWQIYSCIYFDHNHEGELLPGLIERVGQRMQAVSLCLDRIVLENELNRSSMVWEKTFDGVREPIAIVDLNNEVVRSNMRFDALGLKGDETGRFKINGSIFEIQRYDIRIKDQGPTLSTIVHFQDQTAAMNLREQMIHVEKMSALGHLAGHIAHELNNPLTGIRSLAQILLKQSKDQRMTSDLTEVERAAHRCQDIILNLLNFARGTLNEKTTVADLNEIVKRTLPFLKSALGRLNHSVEFDRHPLLIEVEPHLMQQVVFNLVNNACQAVGAQGEVLIETTLVDSNVQLIVSDNGPGVPKDMRSQIFEPFFTTKQEGQGTGLGLSFSRAFVRKLGGEITCEEGLNGGALFRVQLPLAASKKAGAA